MSEPGTDEPGKNERQGETTKREVLRMVPTPGAAPTVGPWLWAMEETRRGLLHTVRDLDQATLDWRGGAGADNSIGSLLYHIALVELSWLYEDTLLVDPPEHILALLPHPSRDAQGRLQHVPAETLAQHLDRLARARAEFMRAMTGMSEADWHTLREPPETDYACAPAWVVFHLVEHEAGHLFQIREILRRRRAKG